MFQLFAMHQKPKPNPKPKPKTIKQKIEQYMALHDFEFGFSPTFERIGNWGNNFVMFYVVELSTAKGKFTADGFTVQSALFNCFLKYNNLDKPKLTKQKRLS